MEQFEFIYEGKSFVQGHNTVAMQNIHNFEVREFDITPEILNAMQSSNKSINMNLIEIIEESVDVYPINATETSISEKWSHNAILCLILTYGEQLELMQNATVRNSQVWQIISDILKRSKFHYSPKQCKWKFAYLKNKYNKAKDSRKASNSGGTPVNFTYFEQMDEILCKSHGNGLPASASSLEYTPQNISPNLDLDGVYPPPSNNSDEPINIPNRKRKRPTITDTISNAIENLNTHRNKLDEGKKSYRKEKIEIAKKNQELLERQLEIQERVEREHSEFMMQLLNKL